MFTVSSEISWIYDDLDYRCMAIEGMLNGINDKLSFLLQRQTENNTNFVSELAALSEDMGRLNRAALANNLFVDEVKAGIMDMHPRIQRIL